MIDLTSRTRIGYTEAGRQVADAEERVTGRFFVTVGPAVRSNAPRTGIDRHDNMSLPFTAAPCNLTATFPILPCCPCPAKTVVIAYHTIK
jgi:hypothetical protein